MAFVSLWSSIAGILRRILLARRCEKTQNAHVSLGASALAARHYPTSVSKNAAEKSSARIDREIIIALCISNVPARRADPPRPSNVRSAEELDLPGAYARTHTRARHRGHIRDKIVVREKSPAESAPDDLNVRNAGRDVICRPQCAAIT